MGQHLTFSNCCVCAVRAITCNIAVGYRLPAHFVVVLALPGLRSSNVPVYHGRVKSAEDGTTRHGCSQPPVHDQCVVKHIIQSSMASCMTVRLSRLLPNKELQFTPSSVVVRGNSHRRHPFATHLHLWLEQAVLNCMLLCNSCPQDHSYKRNHSRGQFTGLGGYVSRLP